MATIQLFSSQDFDTLPFLETEEGQKAKAFLTAFMKGSSKHYISNIATTMYCLKVDTYILPVTVNDTEYENSYVSSPFGVITYAQEELQRYNHFLLTPLFLPLIKGIGKLFKWGKINRVVTVNNWLLPTNLYPELSKEQIEGAVSLLQKHFPTHSILWRSLNNTQPPHLLDRFRQLPCKLFFIRPVYFFDPLNKDRLNSKQKWNIKHDHKLIETNGYQVISGEELTEKDIPRIRELYTSLYLEKYTSINPQFTEAFIRLVIEKKLFPILALRKEGKIDGVVGYCIKGNAMTTSFLGYDTHLPQTLGLYRMLTSLCIYEADRLKLLLHHSSGAAHFKRVRGMYPVLEYTAVFDKHLPKSRRLVWSTLSTLLNNIGKPILTHLKV